MTMHRRLLPVAAILLAAVFAAPAQANFTVGIADQHAAMFDNQNFQSLRIKRVRYLVAYDWYKLDWQRNEVDAFMNRARAAGADVLVHFTSRRGCYVGSRYSKRKVCRAPSVKRYRSSFKRFQRLYPWVKTYGAWNEGNHVSQPVARKPKLAAKYFLAARSLCRSCKIVAADVLDQKNMASWVRSFLRHAKGKARIFGLHNYGDVNRRRSSGTRELTRLVPGEVWLTETGGILQMRGQFRRSESRQARATKYMFKLVSRYDSRQSGMRSRVTRLYNYQWTGAKRSAKFDAGLVNPSGSQRRAYKQFKKSARPFKR
jgi:Glycosyl hydrolase catalytic core